MQRGNKLNLFKPEFHGLSSQDAEGSMIQPQHKQMSMQPLHLKQLQIPAQRERERERVLQRVGMKGEGWWT